MKPRLQKNDKYIQSLFNPQNPKKYRGKYPIIARSSMEIKAMRWMDNNPNVLSWGSESVIVPYQGLDGKLHRYFVDIVCEMKRKDGNIEKFLIEVKPFKQTLPPTPSLRKSKKTILYESYQYSLNQAKWSAARTWCEKKGYKFWILTEKHLK
jgi:hypothetical protein